MTFCWTRSGNTSTVAAWLLLARWKCAPSGTAMPHCGPGAPADGPRHHYMFELYALDTQLEVKPSTQFRGTSWQKQFMEDYSKRRNRTEYSNAKRRCSPCSSAHANNSLVRGELFRWARLNRQIHRLISRILATSGFGWRNEALVRGRC